MPVTGTEGLVLLVARVLFGGVITFMGLNHFLQTRGMIGYAKQKGLPAPKAAVLGSGAALVLGGLAIVTGVFPVLGAAVVAGYLVAAALTVHDFWAVPEEQQETEMTQFLKNAALAGGALALAAIGPSAWAFSLNIHLF